MCEKKHFVIQNCLLFVTLRSDPQPRQSQIAYLQLRMTTRWLFSIILTALLCSQFIVAFFPGHGKFGTSAKSVTRGREGANLRASVPERNIFGSKLMPPYSQKEMEALLKEFNITNFDVNRDPEIAKWAPSKQFFEKFGFQNNTERYKRKTMHVKMDFYSNYTNPILPQYKTFISDMLTVVFLQTIDSRFSYDALFAFGLCTQYYTIMKGYALQDEVWDPLTQSICIPT